MILPEEYTKVNDTIELDNETYCWHDDLERYTWCNIEWDTYEVASGNFYIFWPVRIEV